MIKIVLVIFLENKQKASAIISPQVKVNYIQMLSNTFISALLLLTVLTLPAACITVSFQNYAYTSYFYCSFTVGYISAGTNISVIVNPTDPTAIYNIYIWRPTTQAPNERPFQISDQLNGPKSYVSTAVDMSGNWRVQILPVAQDFGFTVQFAANGQTINRFYGIASYGRVFATYYGTPGTYSANLSLGTGSLNEVDFGIYGPFDSLTVSGGNSVGSQINQDTWNAYISFAVAKASFYYIVVKPNNNMLKTNTLIRLLYMTDVFQCAFQEGVADPNGYLQGCSLDAPTRGFPCISNNYDGKCNSCYSPYSVDSKGRCMLSLDCPQFQYYHFGVCQKVIDNCIVYQKIGTGACKLCKVGYNLVQYGNGTQLCDQATPNCTQRQYLVGKICLNKVENCANFDQSTGTCRVCIPNYNLINNSCIYTPPQIVQCPTGQSFIGGFCQTVDPYCIYYSDSITCQICTLGYKLNNNKKCQKIICGSRQYSSKGFCDNVSPLCDNFDPLTGNCTTCITNYNLLQNGSCVQNYGGGIVVKSKVTCQDRFYLVDNTCAQVSSLCDLYNRENGKCITCLDSINYALINGICKDVNSLCSQTPRTFYFNGECIPVNKLCGDFYPTNGSCTNCLDQSVLNPLTGRCMYNDYCKDYQYYDDNGRCIKGDGSCKSYFYQTNSCQTCEEGYEMNGNFCCRISNYMSPLQCKLVLRQNCTQWTDRNGCFTCSPGYQKTDGLFFSKCKPV